MNGFKTFLRTLAAIAALLMAAWLAFPMSMNVINIGNIAGIVLCLWILFLCIAPLHRAVKAAFFRFGFTRFLYRLVSFLMTAFLLYGAVCTAAMAVASRNAPEKNATAVVLGAQVTGSGKPSRILNRRIIAAEQYLKDNPEANAVLTGGKGTDEVISEADCMYNELIDRGIDAQRLFKEDKATDTTENFRFSRQMIEENQLNPAVAVVTDGFHQLRARLIAQKQEVSEQIGAVSADTEWVFVPTYTVREWFALPAVWLK